MTSPVKKCKKKSPAGESRFDYNILIPKGLDERSRGMVEMFLRNEQMTDDLREEALQVLAQALMCEPGGARETKAVRECSESETAASNLNEEESLTIKESGNGAENKTHGDNEAERGHKQNGEFEPNPECLSEDRQRINVGWMAGPSDAKEEFDRKIAVYSQRLGCQMYNFITYPIGGVKRGFWEPSCSTYIPPPIDLPDLQLQNHLWETYVNGQISTWIDCDSEDEQLAVLSEKELVKELNYLAYMGLRSVVIRLRRADSPRLAHLLNHWMWTKNVNIGLWVFVPTSLEGLIRSPDDPRDCWSIWADFRSLCSNFSSQKLIAGLHLTSDIDDEFIEHKLIVRWKAEPLATFWVESDVFVTDPVTNKAILPSAHCHLLQELWMSDNGRIIVRGPSEREAPANLRLEYAQALRNAVRDVTCRIQGIADEGFLADGNIDYMDVLQAPLQPLADNLDSNIYNTFEQDPIKYRRYREAIEAAISDLGETATRPEELVLYVLGAGRGPLVTASLEAERNYNGKYRSKKEKLWLKVIVVEKNPNAIVTLRYMNEKVWRGRCVLIESDMRQVPDVAKKQNFPQPDIIVSELLGSFGDNELSPECLDGVTSLLKPTTISIPQSYTSYIAPIMSLHMHQTIKSSGASYWNSGIPGHGKNGTMEQEDGTYKQSYPQGQQVSNLDQIYVVFLRQYCSLDESKPVFTFVHPNFLGKSNERSSAIKFKMDRAADLMGFAGYFHMSLYKDIRLSIVPSTYSKGMISWFPALIPLRKLHRVKDGDNITFLIDRKVDSNGVWYEWRLEYTGCDGERQTTVLQNKDGESYYMKLL